MASNSQRGRALVAEAVRRTTDRMRKGERGWRGWRAFGCPPLSRESRLRANIKTCGIVDARRAARRSQGATDVTSGNNLARLRQKLRTATSGDKKGQLTLPFFADIGDWSRYLRAQTLPSYFFDENAANFLLNFSTRPAVSMIFCWPV